MSVKVAASGASPAGSLRSRWVALWPDLSPDLPRFLLAIGCVPLISAMGAAQPALMKRVLDGHVVPGVAEGLWGAACLYLATVLGSFAVEGVYTIALSVAAERTIYRLRQRIVTHTLGLSQRFFERQPTGQVLTRATSDVDALSEALSQGSISILLDVSNMGAVLLAMFWLDHSLTLALLALAPPLIAMIEFFRRRMRVLFTQVRDALAALNAFTAERLAGVEVLQLYRQEERTQARFCALDAAHRDANVKNNIYDAALYALIDGISSMCVGLMLYWGGRQLGVLGPGGDDVVSVGLVVAFVDYIDRLFRPLREFSSKVTFLQRAGASLEKIFWLLGVDQRITPGSVELPPSSPGRLVLRDVRFAYRSGGEEQDDILKGITLTVEPGEVVAVVGRTGSGKSTLVRLLARVHDGYRGSIEVDGVELREIAPASVRKAIGTVRQEVQLFTDSLYFNLTLGEPVDAARLNDALQLTNAQVLVDRHPDGIEQPIRERGANVSSGEGQILALARAMVRDPTIVILDEATASVDPLSERLLQEGIERVFARKTCLVIAHRLSTITRADRIVVLDAGRIIEVGTHPQLIALGGAYAALYEQGFEARTLPAG